MATRSRSARSGTQTQTRTANRPGGRRQPARRGGGARRWLWPAVTAVAVVGVLFAIFATSGGHSGSTAASYQVGSPGVGQAAPTFTLPSTAGHPISLSDYRGKTVLLYFQEGVGCEPCWTQMKDLEKQAVAAQVRAAGIDQIMSITTQPVDVLAQKARDEGVSMPVLSDQDLTVSRAYTANEYGMMGTSMDGHTFVLIGPDGTIQWRADYGGAPKYTMYVPPAQLMAQLKAGRRG